jgi:antitoxin component of MazEF toxin-antitoxin module
MVALPPEILEGLNWKLGDEVNIQITTDGKILIQKSIR